MNDHNSKYVRCLIALQFLKKIHFKLGIFLVINQVLPGKITVTSCQNVIGLYQELRPEVYGLARKTDKSNDRVPNQVPRNRKLSKRGNKPEYLILGRFLVEA